MPFPASRHCRVAVAIIVAVSPGLGSLPALAQSTATRHEITLPEQALADALRALGQVAQVNVVFDPEAVRGKRAPALDGRYTPAEALARLLAGSGLDARPTPGGSYAIEPPSASSPAARTSDAAEASRMRDGTYTFDPLRVIGKVEGFSATRMPTALKDIAQSVSIIGRETLQEQNAYTLDRAMNWATGITTTRASSTQSGFSARGFDINAYHVDGGAPLSIDVGNTAGMDLSQYERIELLRGADALFGGNGAPGGSVNLARKRPLADPAASLAVSAGSWDTYRAEMDLSDRISADGRLRGRLVAAHENQAYFYDNAQRRMNKLYAVLDYDASARTRLTLGGTREDTMRIPFNNGLPRYSDGADPHLPRSTGLTFPWARIRGNTSEVFAQAEQGLGERWRVKAGATRINSGDAGLFPRMSSAIHPATGRRTGPPTAQDYRMEVEQTSLDLNLAGSFDWNGRVQEVVLGADAMRADLRTDTEGRRVTGPAVNPFDFDPGLYPAPVASPYDPVSGFGMQMRQHGIYAAFKLRPLEHWAITLGARNNFIRTHTTMLMRSGPVSLPGMSLRKSDSGVLTPYASVVYALNARYSLYASLAEVFNGNTGVMANGSVLDPVRGTNREAGIKGFWHDGRLNGSVALFKIEQDNVPQQDPNPPLAAGPNCCFIPVTQRSKGVEAELSGVLAPGWQLGAGYTFNINRKSSGATLNTATPKHLLKLWTHYQLPGRASDWAIGGGVTAQTRNYSESLVCREVAPSGFCVGDQILHRNVQGFYTVATLRADYRLAERWNVAMNLGNLLDRRYYQSVGTPIGGNWYGEPRNWTLTLRGQF